MGNMESTPASLSALESSQTSPPISSTQPESGSPVFGRVGWGDMAPATVTSSPVDPERRGPHPSFIEVAKSYIFEHQIQKCLASIGASEAKEDSNRLHGVAYIDSVRRSLQLPVRTYNTACVYYHKFRLRHADHEYNHLDAAVAALFTACKIEDTLKKSKEILCAAYNLKVAPSEHLSSDDALFEQHSKAIIGLERLMLEGASFDFRTRHPQKLLTKMCKHCGLARDPVGVTAWNMSLDLYRTFAPLKQTTYTMAFACVELSGRLLAVDGWEEGLTRGPGNLYERFGARRDEIMETLLDLLDLYTHHRPHTLIGPAHPLESFISIRITLNQEASADNLPRYTGRRRPPTPATDRTDPSSAPSTARNGATSPAATSKPQRRSRPSATPDSPTAVLNGAPAVAAPASQGAGTTGAVARGSEEAGVGARGQNGTVRFMLDAARATDEKRVVGDFFRDEEEEVEIEVEVEAAPAEGGRRRRG